MTDKHAGATNWTRRLLWAWLLLSASWIAALIVWLLLNPERSDSVEQNAVVAWMLGPPLVAFFVGSLLNVMRRWVIKAQKAKRW